MKQPGLAESRWVFSCARIAPALLAIMMSAAAAAAGIPPADVGDHDLNAVVDLVTFGQFHAADARIDTALKQPGLSANARRAFAFQRERMHTRRARLEK